MAGSPHFVENKLAELFGFEYTVMLGRARSGLAALIEVLRDGSDNPVPVILPENICPVLVTAIRAGGGYAVPVPVSPKTGLPDDKDFIKTINTLEKPGIVMPTHLYGFEGNYVQTMQLAREKNWFILENDTNAIRLESTSTADALLVSFGYAKPIEIGTGGALLTNDGALARTLQQRVSGYVILDDNARKKEEDCMLRRRVLRAGQTTSDTLEQICEVETGLSCFRFDGAHSDLLLQKLDQFPEERARRVVLCDLWDRALAPLDRILEPVPLAQPVPWRLIRRVQVGRDHFAQRLWHNDIDAGINYRSLWREVPGGYLTGTPTEPDLWGEQVLNLWVTENYNRERIKMAGQLLEEAANEL